MKCRGHLSGMQVRMIRLVKSVDFSGNFFALCKGADHCDVSSSFACSFPRSSCLLIRPSASSPASSCIVSSPSISYLSSFASISCLRCSSSNSTFCWKYICVWSPWSSLTSWAETAASSFLFRCLRTRQNQDRPRVTRMIGTTIATTRLVVSFLASVKPADEL